MVVIVESIELVVCVNVVPVCVEAEVDIVGVVIVESLTVVVVDGVIVVGKLVDDIVDVGVDGIVDVGVDGVVGTVVVGIIVEEEVTATVVVLCDMVDIVVDVEGMVDEADVSITIVVDIGVVLGGIV